MHPVSKIPSPISLDSGSELRCFPAAEDNLVWWVRCLKSNRVAVVDGPDAQAALAASKQDVGSWEAIWITHTHGDHVGILHDLQRRGQLASFRVVGAHQMRQSIPGITDEVGEGSSLALGEIPVQVWHTEGHLRWHLSYLLPGVVFCGDTLFGAGCGYLVDGPAEAMFQSLCRLAELPGSTLVACAHEYTWDNLRFAATMEPENPNLRARIRECWRRRVLGEASVPSTIAEERATNPFLRPGSPEIIANLAAAWSTKEPPGSAAARFAALRLLKDSKAYRRLGDADLLGLAG